MREHRHSHEQMRNSRCSAFHWMRMNATHCRLPSLNAPQTGFLPRASRRSPPGASPALSAHTFTCCRADRLSKPLSLRRWRLAQHMTNARNNNEKKSRLRSTSSAELRAEKPCLCKIKCYLTASAPRRRGECSVRRLTACRN